MVNIRIGTESEKQQLITTYPYTKNVIGENGYFIIAETDNNMIGFLWAFKRDIPAPIEQSEIFINVIEVLNINLRSQGIGSRMIEKIIGIEKEEKVYQVRAYCDIRNIPSHRLWLKNNFANSPVKMPDNTIAGSFVSYVL